MKGDELHPAADGAAAEEDEVAIAVNNLFTGDLENRGCHLRCCCRVGDEQKIGESGSFMSPHGEMIIPEVQCMSVISG